MPSVPRQGRRLVRVRFRVGVRVWARVRAKAKVRVSELSTRASRAALRQLIRLGPLTLVPRSVLGVVGAETSPTRSAVRYTSGYVRKEYVCGLYSHDDRTSVATYSRFDRSNDFYTNSVLWAPENRLSRYTRS